MRVIVKVVVILVFLLLLISCTSENLPSEPLEPGKSQQAGIVGRAFYAGLEQLGYAAPTKFSISKDSLSKGEALALSVQNEDYVYKYYYVSINGQWQQQTFSGELVGNSNWIKSSASASLATDNLPEGDSYVVAYSCSLVNANWDCHGNKWQIHQFAILPKPEGSQPPPKDQPQQQLQGCYDDLSDKMSQKVLWRSDFEDLDDEGWIQGLAKPKAIGELGKLPEFVLDENVKHNGKRSLRISSGITESYGGININTEWVKVIPNTEYVLSFWVKGQDVISTTGHLYVGHVASKETPAGGLSGAVYLSTSIPSDRNVPQTYDWQKVTQKFTIPSDNDAASITILFQNSKGTVWLDDLQIMTVEKFSSLPETTLDVETRTGELAAPARHYFLRDKPINAQAVLRNQKDQPQKYAVKAVLTFCGKEMKKVEYNVDVPAHERVDRSLMNIDPTTLAVGDYLLTARIEKDGKLIDTVEHPVGLRLDPKPEFVFSMGIPTDSDLVAAKGRLGKLDSHYLTPLFYNGEKINPVAADVALSKNMPFVVRLMPDLAFPKKKRIDGGDFRQYPEGLSDDTMWLKAAQAISSAVARTSHFPAFFPRIFTSDDFAILSGWDWADRNKQRFKELTGIDAPTPKEFEGKLNPYTVTTIAQPKGSVDVNEPWLAYNRFLSRDVFGAYNKAVTSAVVQANPHALIGPVPGGQGWPLFITSLGLYPPYNFGKNGFNMISYYTYLVFGRPPLSYIYWTDVAKMVNRDLPVYIMSDSYFTEEKSYFWNNFYLLLASGVDGIAYFIEPATTPEFWTVAKENIGPIIERIGPLQAKLDDDKHKVGLLVSISTATYNVDYPLQALCIFNNLLMSHVDVEAVSEEEILNGRLSQYDAVVLGDVDWLREEVIAVLSSSSIPVLLDAKTEVQVNGNNVKKLGFSLSEGHWTCGAGADPDYGKPERLQQIRTEVEKIVPPDVKINSDTVIFRTFKAGDAKYMWLVNVHSDEEYQKLADWMVFKVGTDFNLVKNDMINYLTGRNVYNGVETAKVSVRNVDKFTVVDVISGQKLASSSRGDWTDFTVEIPRLAGKLIAFYPAAPTTLKLTVPNLVSPTQTSTFQVQVLSSNNPINAVFPLFLKLLDPSGKTNPYTRYTATTPQGNYELPILLGANAPIGMWTLQVKELSTGMENSATFIVS